MNTNASKSLLFSINPSVDIGQVEGAFVMGLGFWLTEKMVYDETTGQLLTAGTWDYKPPVSKVRQTLFSSSFTFY